MPNSLEKERLLLHRATDFRSLWTALVRLCEAAFPARNYHLSVNFVDFNKPQLVFFHGDLEERIGLMELNRAYLISPVGPYLRANPGLRLVREWDHLPSERAWLESEFYTGYCVKADLRYLLGLPFWSANNVTAWLCSMRSHDEAPFGAAEEELAMALYSDIETAIVRTLCVHRERTLRLSLQDLLQSLPFPSMLLSWDGKLLHANQTGREFAALWNFGSRQSRLYSGRENFRVPELISSALRDLKEELFNKMSRLEPIEMDTRHRVDHPEAKGCYAYIRPLLLSRERAMMPHFLVELHAGDPVSRNSRAERDWKLTELTPREREVALLVCDGMSNKEIANHLSKGLGTVKTQLNTIFRKLNVPNRGRLMSILHG